MVDPREAQDNYERACESHHEACQTHLDASRAWGRDYADMEYPLPPPPSPPCDGSSTDSWESLEALHGCCARQYVGRPTGNARVDAAADAAADADNADRQENYSFAEHCDELGLPSGERNAYLQRLEDRHAKAGGNR